jgi:hypothetical protein
MRIETALAKASLDNVALRDPKATDHKMSMAALQKLTPGYDWTAAFRALGIPARDLNVRQPRFLEEVERQLGATPSRTGRPISTGSCSTRSRPPSPALSSMRTSRSRAPTSPARRR